MLDQLGLALLSHPYLREPLGHTRVHDPIALSPSEKPLPNTHTATPRIVQVYRGSPGHSLRAGEYALGISTD